MNEILYAKTVRFHRKITSSFSSTIVIEKYLKIITEVPGSIQ